ncbi:nitroreductase family protein [Bacteroidota bacterium]
MIRDLILKNRSYRRFQQDYKIEETTLKELVDLARISGSGANKQPLKFILSCDYEKNSKIFSNTKWAGYLTDWPGPEEGERPSAYIIILGDTQILKAFGCDHGIAAQSILLGAAERDLGGCMIGSISRDDLRRELSIPDQYEILLILAIGKPKEKIVLENLPPDGSVKYWRDDKQVHHVPKRNLDELILDI